MKIHLQPLNEELQNLVDISLEDVSSAQELKSHPHFKQLSHLLVVSEWASFTLKSQEDLILTPFLQGEFDTPYEAEHIEEQVRMLFLDEDENFLEDQILLMQRLRDFRKKQTLAIAYRDVNQLATLEETMFALSHLASCFVENCVHYLHEKESHKYGQPCGKNHETMQLILLAMGKLGGNELNFSSDIDLIAVYPEEGETNGKKVISNQQFFSKVVQGLFRLLDSVTEHGIVYRVDFRLRPFGESGALTMSQKAIVRYYFDVGRDWERYALIKARAISGDPIQAQALLEALRPFIYRDYVDYTSLESLRTMKTNISDEVKKKKLFRNVKLGPGGIREIEFIVQAYQLIYGGREAELRNHSILQTLDYLAASGRIDAKTVEEMVYSYHFLRHTENRLQMFLDLQTHDLPFDRQQKLRLAWSMGFVDWPSFVKALLKAIKIIKNTFLDLFGTEDDLEFYEERQEFLILWKKIYDNGRPITEVENPEQSHQRCINNAQVSREAVQNLLLWLEAKAFANPAQALNILLSFLKDCYCSLDEMYQDHTNRIIFYALMRYQSQELNDTSFALFMNTLVKISKYPAYFALLTENRKALKSLIQLTHRSSWISEFLGLHPLLLDELLSPQESVKPLSKKELTRELNHNLSQFSPKDYEKRLDVLREFHHIQTLKVAISDLSGNLPLMIVSDHLSDIAEVILNVVLRLARRDLGERFGDPICIDAPNETRIAKFAILAYGKLGGIETGYGSDLDLVFIHNSNNGQTSGEKSIDNDAFFIKLAQRVMYYLNSNTAAGYLYDVDTRLRPSGMSGLLAVSVERFEAYQKTEAWTWEHQALIRARIVAGSQTLAKQFRQIRQDVLMKKRAISFVKKEVSDMREKMRTAVAKADNRVNPVQACMINIEFIVQYMVLAYAHHFPVLIKFTDNIRQLAGLEATGLLSSWEAMVLRDVYRTLRSCLHQTKLRGQKAEDIEIDEKLLSQIKVVEKIWLDIIER